MREEGMRGTKDDGARIAHAAGANVEGGSRSVP